jgi:hypothetical protein
MDTGGRIKYDTRNNPFNNGKRWSEKKDKLLWEVMNQKTGTLSQKVKRYWKHCDRLELSRNGSPYPTACINRFYVLRKAIKDTLSKCDIN